MQKRTAAVLFLLLLTPVLALPASTQKLLEYNQQLALSITFLAAFLAGFISFLSPCGFALLPIFFVTSFREKRRAFFMSSLFALGMLITFTIFGALAGILGQFFNPYREFVAWIAGFLILGMGILILFNKGFGFEQRGVVRQKSVKEVFLLGLSFGVAWSPCVMPVLTGIVLVGASLGNVIESTLLLSVFSIGAVSPFLLLAYFSDRTRILQRWLQQKPRIIHLFNRSFAVTPYSIIAGLILIVLGLIVISWKGTSFFMATIPSIIPWTMETAYMLNDTLTTGMFTASWANWLGLALVCITVILTIHLLRKGEKR